MNRFSNSFLIQIGECYVLVVWELRVVSTFYINLSTKEITSQRTKKNLASPWRLILNNKNDLTVMPNEAVDIFLWFKGFGGKIESRTGRFKKWQWTRWGVDQGYFSRTRYYGSEMLCSTVNAQQTWVWTYSMRIHCI